MLNKIFILAIVFGIIAAEPVKKRSFLPNDLSTSEDGSELSLLPDLSSLINSICSLLKIKVSAITLAVQAIEWLVSNFVVIAVGAVGALGFCKLSGLCGIIYEKFLPVNDLQQYVNPEYIDTAERFLMTAVEKYAEKKRSV